MILNHPDFELQFLTATIFEDWQIAKKCKYLEVSRSRMRVSCFSGQVMECLFLGKTSKRCFRC